MDHIRLLASPQFLEDFRIWKLWNIDVEAKLSKVWSQYWHLRSVELSLSFELTMLSHGSDLSPTTDRIAG